MDDEKTGSTLATKWSVAEIQRAIVQSTGVDESIPNVSFGFFKRMECDLVQVSDAGYLHEFEIKRSWEDFMADFKKAHFHDDIRIMRLTFVLPAEFAGEKLKKWCAAHYKEFKRSFDFMFYLEDGPTCSFPQAKWVHVSDYRSALQLPEQFRTETYITPEMAREIHRNDKDAPYRRKLFLEEIVKLYRLGVVRLWHRSSEKEAAQAMTEEPQEPQKPPVRNCDRFNTGDVPKDADDAMRAMLEEMRSDGNFGFRGVASYLLSPVSRQPADNGLPAGVRAATEDEVAAGDAKWCKMCDRADCALSHHDALVHGCSRMVNKEALS